ACREPRGVTRAAPTFDPIGPESLATVIAYATRHIMTPRIARIFIASSIAALLPLSAAAQGTSAASISGVVTDTSGGVLPGVAVEVSSPVLSKQVRTTTSNERGEYRIVELRPGIYTVTFARQGFASFRREGIELTSNFNAAVNAELRVGVVEQSI